MRVIGRSTEARGRWARLAAALGVLVTSLALGSTAFAGNGGTGAPGGTRPPGPPHHRHPHHHKSRPRAYAPAPGRIFHGVSETTEGVRGVRRFTLQVGSHPAVVEDF